MISFSFLIKNKNIPAKPFWVFFILVLFLHFNHAALAQDNQSNQAPGSKRVVMEFPDDPYHPANKESRLLSPGYTYSSPGFFTTQVNVSPEGFNIVGDAANEPSLAFDPNDPDRMVIGWRHFETIFNNFRQAGIGYTSDGGETWTFQEVIDPGIFRSDPVLAVDAQGNFFYNSLTVDNGEYWCDVYKSTDGGASWDAGTFAYGGDKQWFSIDKSGGSGAGNIYHYWSSVSICPPDKFTRSTNAGLSYEDCSAIPGNPYWGITAIDGEGNLYAAGSQGNDFVVARSSQAQNGSAAMAWDFSTTVSLDGSIVGFGGYDCPNPVGLLGQAIVAVDSSGGPTHNNVYLLCSVDRFSFNDPCDVMFSRSTNGGLTWSLPVRVNDDPGNNAWQWFGTMSVAPDGRIDAIWLDTRENPGQLISKLYYSASWDGGITWSQNIPLGESFDPHVGWPQQDKMGDYFDMFSTLEGAHLAWAGTFNGEQDVFYAFISPEITHISGLQTAGTSRLEQNYPNPFQEETHIGFHLNTKEWVTLEVLDLTGRKLAVLLSGERAQGPHQIVFDASGLPTGMYYYRLTAGTFEETRKMVVR